MRRQRRPCSKAATGRSAAAKHLVPAGDEADAFIVPARMAPHEAAPVGLFLVERARCEVRGYPTQDGARAADVLFSATPATLQSADGLPALERAIDIGIAAACAEGVGAMDKLVAITVEYMNTRKQFGATLASFQALRHRMADVKMQLELARGMSYFASLKLNAATGAAPPCACRRPRYSSGNRCASSASNAFNCTAASASPTRSRPATTSSA